MHLKSCCIFCLKRHILFLSVTIQLFRHSAADASSDVISFPIYFRCYSLDYSLLAHNSVDVV